jgi:membrane protein involved in colicin uptake
VHQNPSATIIDDLVVDNMIEQVILSTIYQPLLHLSTLAAFYVPASQQRTMERQMETRPTPDSTFIIDAQSQIPSQSSSTTIRQGDLAQKLLQMQREKDRANEERKLAILEAKYQEDVKKAEEKTRKKKEQEELKAQLAEEKAMRVAEKREKRKQEAELNKKVREETRKIISEVRKEVTEKKKKDIAEKKAEEKILATEKKEAERQAQRTARLEANKARLEAHRAEMQAHRNEMEADRACDVEDENLILAKKKKVNMFDEFRAPRKK